MTSVSLSQPWFLGEGSKHAATAWFRDEGEARGVGHGVQACTMSPSAPHQTVSQPREAQYSSGSAAARPVGPMDLTADFPPQGSHLSLLRAWLSCLSVSPSSPGHTATPHRSTPHHHRLLREWELAGRVGSAWVREPPPCCVGAAAPPPCAPPPQTFSGGGRDGELDKWPLRRHGLRHGRYAWPQGGAGSAARRRPPKRARVSWGDACRRHNSELRVYALALPHLPSTRAACNVVWCESGRTARGAPEEARDKNRTVPRRPQALAQRAVATLHGRRRGGGHVCLYTLDSSSNASARAVGPLGGRALL